MYPSQTPRTTFFSTFLYLSCAFTTLPTGVFSLPTAPEPPIDTPPSIFIRSTNIVYGTRSIWSIIWSCSSIIFACTWIAVHPNIPGPKDSQWTVLFKRLTIMGCALFVPEFVLGWAARQYCAARQIAKRHREHGWTMSHGFFISMGGFTLHDQSGTAIQILNPEELEKLYNEGKVAWPSITEEEIRDRSNGDYLSKGIVLVQMTWFIIQFIVRTAYGLAVTEFEVVTLAFAVISGATYYLWWHKPLDVRCSVPVYLLPHPIVPNPNYREPNSNSTSEPNFTRIQRFPAFIHQQRQKHGILFGVAYVFIHDSLLAFLNAIGEVFSLVTLNESDHDASPTCVHTFYSPWDHTNQHHFLVISFPLCIAVLFGGIHCIAWSFQFPSLHERLAWRITAAFICAEPILFGLLIIMDNYRAALLNICIKTLFITVSLMYFVSRFVLLVLSCITLRALPPSALLEIQWSSLLPHIG